VGSKVLGAKQIAESDPALCWRIATKKQVGNYLLLTKLIALKYCRAPGHKCLHASLNILGLQKFAQSSKDLGSLMVDI
jgi:hypothetical protein